MKIKLLGTGKIGSKSFYTSILLDNNLLLEIGSGTINLLKTIDFDINKLKTVLISHVHVDHYMDIFSLILEKFENNSKKDLNIISPLGIKDLTKRLLYIINADINYNKFEKLLKKHKIYFIETENNDIVIDNYHITPFEMEHDSEEIVKGFVIEKNGIRIGFTSETSDCEKLSHLILNSDFIFIDASDLTSNKKNIGVDTVMKYCEKNPEKKFFAVNRGDYNIPKNKFGNLIFPNDGDEIEIG